jgi:hypothetical protein
MNHYLSWVRVLVGSPVPSLQDVKWQLAGEGRLGFLNSWGKKARAHLHLPPPLGFPSDEKRKAKEKNTRSKRRCKEGNKAETKEQDKIKKYIYFLCNLYNGMPSFMDHFRLKFPAKKHVFTNMPMYTSSPVIPQNFLFPSLLLIAQVVMQTLVLKMFLLF